MDPPHHSILVLAGIVLLALYIVTLLQRKWTQRRIARENHCEPPPSLYMIDPVFGIDNVYNSVTSAKHHRFLERGLANFRNHGNTFSATRLGTNIIVTRDPLNVKTILSLKFKDFGLGDRIHSFGPLLGHGIFTTDGEHWAQSRAMIRPNFSKDQVAHLEIFEELMGDLLALIPTDGSTFDLQELFFSYTIDSATEFLFGHSVQSLKKRRSAVQEDAEKDFASAFNYAQDAIAHQSRIGRLSQIFPDRKAQRCHRVCHELVEQFVDKALRYRANFDEEKGADDSKQKYLFLQGLAQQTGDRKRIRDELMNVLLAGRDTTASLLSNMFFMLAKHPHVWAKLQEEIATLDGRIPTYSQLRNLTYLKYCMNESLRLHPVVPANSRVAMTDTVLPVGGGPNGQSPVFVSKGTVVGYSTYSMHRREDFYGPDAEEFRPERWATLRPGWEYLPFNGGPRICVGQQYALTEAGYVTVRLAQRFSVLESRDAGAWEESLTLTLCSRNGTLVGMS
ncbi:putative cytochrome P450 alkane hydroxylase [Aspergillus steynii IBT 23096]|uniref:Putative cytochrome P450 alkane hydroxylase n=1 Tax=Aspergillus steynii IBT 23096 TaxID=1392250 RepID=A0A2I2GA78_9EURO|nr:putative cytochrome P450 alkane hydroxylase [Aspergillus steynii IBT 23096]PLB49781.1 putative cytochrome P450 alkane hydroxylase [Aspergillus steynii IBT 23096]